ncbi:hypothetical protein LEP1GSC083_0004 [Leptospira interrogans serovar Pyrogenes str. L0374]|uniref:Uncharacterized protein n=1 Tax=Leptospira interrogans serovar Pyrogenes str. L0374 TaxID=1049928 RepID=M6KBP7_LEPIR|nr:hypothetical protein LEP1GSC083_0004 [Leptospira interrogans serovar Pyrogenes str. L0374]
MTVYELYTPQEKKIFRRTGKLDFNRKPFGWYGNIGSFGY